MRVEPTDSKSGQNDNNKERRNIVVFICDQLRPDFLPSYGCRAFATPNIDRLAAAGVVFDRAITQSPVCAPARATMMTGRYLSDHGVWTNDIPFRSGLDYLPQMINRLDYATAAFGKLHHAPANDGKGFQYLRQMEEGRLKTEEPYLKWLQSRQPEVKEVFNDKDYIFQYPLKDYYEHWIATEAISFITDVQKEDKPFFTWISFQGPHTPYDPPAEFKGSVDYRLLPEAILPEKKHDIELHKYRSIFQGAPAAEQLEEVRTAYAEMIVAIDFEIGRITDHLQELGLLENTTIIFSADHGDLLGDHNMNSKGPFPYAGQLDIPLIIANHPEISPGTRSEQLVGNIDIPGTVLDIAEGKERIGMSTSLIDQANGSAAVTREVLFSEFCDSMKVVETRQFRLAYYPFQNVSELYDKTADPEERTNLAGRPEYAAVEHELYQRIVDFMIVAKGIRVEAHDLIPGQRQGIENIHRHFLDTFPVAFPISSQEHRRTMKECGLNNTYNEFCKKKEIIL